jgi:hypothetical protein
VNEVCSTLQVQNDPRLRFWISEVIQSSPTSVSKRRWESPTHLPRQRPAERAVAARNEEKCYELAGYVLANQRGLNTPKCRQELAACIQRAIENYLAFEKGKSRYS